MSSGAHPHFPELVVRAEEILFRAAADAQVEHRLTRLIAHLAPGEDGSFPAAHMLAQTLRLIVGHRLNGDEGMAASFAAVAGALMPLVFREGEGAGGGGAPAMRLSSSSAGCAAASCVRSSTASSSWASRARRSNASASAPPALCCGFQGRACGSTTRSREKGHERAYHQGVCAAA